MTSLLKLHEQSVESKKPHDRYDGEYTDSIHGGVVEPGTSLEGQASPRNLSRVQVEPDECHD